MNEQQTGSGPPLPPANWYADPNDANRLRYWDGQSWTEHFAPMPPGQAPTAEPSRALEAQQPSSSDPVRGADDKDAWKMATRRGFRKRGRPEPSIEELVTQLRHEDPRYPLEEQVEVVGETYQIKGIKRVYADYGMPITQKGTTLEEARCLLVPEPWNPHDPNAVAVTIGVHQVGHLPADLAVSYAAPLAGLAAAGALATGEARLWAKSDGGVVRARVTILIPEASMFGR